MTVADQSRKEVNSSKCSILSAKKTTKFGTWNARTLFQCGKLDQIIHEMDNYSLEILGISEMRWTGKGKMSKGNKTILYSGYDNLHTHGVGIILSKDAGKALIGWTPVNHRIITARLCSRHGKTTIIQAYAPTENSDDDEKDEFYGTLQDLIDSIPNHDIKILMGDFNAQIGQERQGLEHNDWAPWISVCPQRQWGTTNLLLQCKWV